MVYFTLSYHRTVFLGNIVSWKYLFVDYECLAVLFWWKYGAVMNLSQSQLSLYTLVKKNIEKQILNNYYCTGAHLCTTMLFFRYHKLLNHCMLLHMFKWNKDFFFFTLSGINIHVWLFLFHYVSRRSNVFSNNFVVGAFISIYPKL